MLSFRRGAIPVLLLTVALALAGCESSEERAERHFQSGMELLEAGDVDRALVEFRNVFRLNGQHREARLTYARIQRERGEIGEAYSQYLRLVEQYPDDLEGRRALGEIAVLRGDWQEAERHARAAREFAPEDNMVIALNAAVDYRKAFLASDSAATEAAVAAARAVLERDPKNPIARRLSIEAHAKAGEIADALAEIDIALATEPDDRTLHRMKLSLLVNEGDLAGTGAHLQRMVALFPEDEEVQALLIAWFMDSGDLKGAEAFLRGLTTTGTPERMEQAKVAVAQFLMATQGSEAAEAELDRLIAAEGANPAAVALFRSLRASIRFEAGRHDEAIAEIEAILADAEPSDRTRDIKVTLARMLEATGNPVGARARAEEVLAEDPTHVGALQMQAAWLIGADRPAEAIVALRSALDQDPRNPETLTLMAQAHLRDGSRELAGERLALAVEVSGMRAAESLRYAAFLIEDDRIPTAESVLVNALRVAPGNVEVLGALGEVYLRQSDFPRAEGVIRELEELATPTAQGVANRLRVALLIRQDKTEESIALVESLIEQGQAGLGASAVVVREHLEAGDVAQAKTYLDTLLAEHPDDVSLKLLRAGVLATSGETAEAEKIYRDLIEADPAAVAPVRGLYALLRGTERATDASALLQSALEPTGRDADLVYLRAVELEAQGDIEGAIALYDELYAKNTGNLIVANNLASLITTHRSDAESLERAFAIARRLRGSDVPAFQDTYGWIEYRRGNFDEALANLEPAAAGLPDDPFVQMHLGLAYAALNRTEDARATLIRALEMADKAGKADAAPFAEARAALQKLPAGN
ncbi:tetratricopeptide repeat protein [Rhodobacter sp. Har01]|uniref:tetratricopeptide repeat protein n=1 Tax=Rhodobacter sp. Har01 TaxID=2883999 RepID=UPI001D06B31F|nr:tetratricopeptide repeat protein [Rhodobacter sp. Har01]MCB6180108.1 tetratricopeptide repeat protein [Rhodobacter sp. Har01]